MRLADLEKALKDMYKRELEILKRIEVLERANETNNDPGSRDPNSGSELPENSINPSEPR